MNQLVYSTLTRIAYANLFERAEGIQDDIATFASYRHGHQVAVTDDGTRLFFYCSNIGELCKKFPRFAADDCITIQHPLNDLTDFLHILTHLFQAAAALPEPPAEHATDIQATVKERLGQQNYRANLLSQWGNACAVTGLSDPRLLRASHAKPWAVATDAERLDPANGFPLAVHLDALFDTGLITFTDDGGIVLSSSLTSESARVLGISEDMHLRTTLSPQQCHYLAYHRRYVFINNNSSIKGTK